MDPKLFAQALLGQGVDQELAGANPYKPFESIADAISQRVIKSAGSGEASTKDAIIGGLLSGLGGGLFSSLGEDYADTQYGRLLSAAKTISAGQDVERPSGIPASVFNRLKTNAALSELATAEADKERNKALANLIQQKTIEAAIENPYRIKQILDAKTALTTGQMPEAVTTIPGRSDVKPMEVYLQQTGGDQSAAQKLFEKDLEKAKQKDVLIKEFIDRPEVKTFSEIAPDVEYLRSIKDNPGALSDIPFIYKFMKVIDPGAVVRESDAGMVIDSKSLDRSLISRLEKLLNAKETLQATDRAELISLADSAAKSRLSQIEGLKVGYKQRAKDLGFDGFDPQIPGISIADIVRAEAQAQGVDPDIAEKIARAESSLNPSAVSPKGARGIMQLMPDTAKELGVNPDDVRENIRGGITYYKKMLERFNNNPEDALAAYNAGPGALEEIKAGKRAMPEETQKYVAKIIGKPLAKKVDTGDSGLAALIKQATEAGASKKEIQQAVLARLGLNDE